MRSGRRWRCCSPWTPARWPRPRGRRSRDGRPRAHWPGRPSASTCWASDCRRGSRVVRSGLPATGSAVNSTRRAPWASTATTSSPRVPASCSSYRCCRPERPTSSPARTLPLLALTTSAVAGPTVPRIAEAKSLLGASGSLSEMARPPGMADEPGQHARTGPRRAGRPGPARRRGPRCPAPAWRRRRDRRPRAGPPGARTAGPGRRRPSPCRGPTRSTGRSVTRVEPPAPRMSPRCAFRVVVVSCSPVFSEGSTTVGDQRTSQAVPPEVSVLCRRAVGVVAPGPRCRPATPGEGGGGVVLARRDVGDLHPGAVDALGDRGVRRPRGRLVAGEVDLGQRALRQPGGQRVGRVARVRTGAGKAAAGEQEHQGTPADQRPPSRTPHG